MKNSPVKVWRRREKAIGYVGMVGKVVLATTIYISGKTFGDQVPYPVAIVELANKERIVCQMVDWEEKDLSKNTKVVLVVRRTQIGEDEDIISYHLKCRPL